MRPIGIIRTPFTIAAGTPIQPVFAQGAEGRVELLEECADGLVDLDGFERIWLVYRFHLASETKLRLVPFRDDHERGVFATFAPCRPNGIGLSCVRLKRMEGLVLHVADVDMLDGTPLLDIKPYVPVLHAFPDSGAGWFGEARLDRETADDRFSPQGERGEGSGCGDDEERAGA